jgi:hypothetical protein
MSGFRHLLDHEFIFHRCHDAGQMLQVFVEAGTA